MSAGPLSLPQARLPQTVQQLSRSRLQRGIFVLLFLVVLGDPIEVELLAECRLLERFKRFARLCIFIGQGIGGNQPRLAKPKIRPYAYRFFERLLSVWIMIRFG
jgi:hypothetical protein